MTYGDWGLLLLGVAIGLAIGLAVWCIDQWAAKRHARSLHDAARAFGDIGANGRTDAQDVNTYAARGVATVAQVEAYLNDLPYDHEREGL